VHSLILLHGAIGSQAQLEPLASKLSRGFDCKSFDFSGHGGLPVSRDDFSIESFAQQLENFIVKQQLAPADIFGYSMGGYVAVYLARHQTELIGKIVTLGTKWKWTPDIALRETRMLNPDKIMEKVPAFAQELSRRHAPQDWKRVLTQTSEMMLGMGDRPPLTLNDMRLVKHPVLVLLADGDVMVTREETEEAVAALANGQLHTVLSSQHPIEKVDLDQVTREITGFMTTFAP
jgi:pimeloyl-ACP methyl ester carboxylesterase